MTILTGSKKIYKKGFRLVRELSGYPAIFLGSGADSDFKFCLKTDTERSRI